MGNRSKIRKSVLCVLVSIAMFSVTPAHAQRRGRDRDAAAEAHYRQGRAHHERGAYEEAIGEYLIAYELSQSPRLLFNIAQVYLLAGNPQKALVYYESFVSREPAGKISDLARRRIEEIRRDLRAKSDEAATEPATDKPDKPDSPKDHDARDASDSRGTGNDGNERPNAAKATGGQIVNGHDAHPRDAGPAGAGRGMRMTGLAVAGLGAVGVAVGVRFGFEARSKQDEIDSQPQGTPWMFDEAYEQGRVANRNMWIAYGAGAGALITGGILYYLGRDTGRAEARQWAVVPMTGHAASGITLLGEL